MEREYKMSQARLDELNNELNFLKTTRSDEVAEQIKIARGFGDLSENSEYDEAKNEQGKLYSRIAELEEILQHVVIVDEVNAPTNMSQGCNRLIRDGAGLAAEPWDLLREYEDRFSDKLRVEGARTELQAVGWKSRQKTEAKPVPPSLSLSKNDLSLTDDQIRLLQTLTEEPLLVDDLIELTEIPTRRVLSALTVLELENLVTQHPGKRYTRAVTLCE